MADAAAPAVRARATVPDLGALAVGAAAATGMAALAAADGGYFPPSWGWTALIGLWIAAAWLFLGRVELTSGTLGIAFLGGLTGLAGWTWLSLLWTENTVQTALEGFRLIGYLGAAAALLLVVRRQTAPALVRGVLAAVALVSTYGLATRLFPDRLGTFDPVGTYRLSEPIGYWNGFGIFAAMGVLLALGVLARDGSLPARILAAAAFPILVCALFFSFSRGAMGALAVGALAMFALDPRRLQLVVAGIVVSVPTAIAVVAAWSSEALTEVDAPLFAAVDQGRVVAVIVAGCSVLAAVATAALAVAEGRVHPGRSARLVFAAVLAVLALGAIGGVVVRFGGPVELVEEAYDAFRAPAPQPGELERRLFSFSGSYRAELWEEAWDQYRENPVVGTGAGTYEQYWNRHRPISHIVRDAHSVYLETLGELGIVGLALLLLALGAPLVAAVGARREPLAIAASGAYVAYLVHAAVDWDWELAGLTLPALGCAVALLALRPTAAALVPASALRYGAAVGAIALAGIALVGLIGASANAASEEALQSSPPDYAEAESQARKARRWARWSSEPWEHLADSQLARGASVAAADSYRKAIAKEPTDWELWFGLAHATSGAEQRRALAEATRLNPRSSELEAFRSENP
jgi:O-Antigen ligase